jgi:hypothetical protein
MGSHRLQAKLQCIKIPAVVKAAKLLVEEVVVKKFMKKTNSDIGEITVIPLLLPCIRGC